MHSERGLGSEDCFTSCGAEAPSHCGIAGSARCRATSAVMISRIAINSCGGIPRTYWRNCSRCVALMHDCRPTTAAQSTRPRTPRRRRHESGHRGSPFALLDSRAYQYSKRTEHDNSIRRDQTAALTPCFMARGRGSRDDCRGGLVLPKARRRKEASLPGTREAASQGTGSEIQREVTTTTKGPQAASASAFCRLYERPEQ